MTPNESPALRTNDEPQRILLEASERIKACYPNGTKIEALIDGTHVIGTTRYIGMTPPVARCRRSHDTAFVVDTESEAWPFVPSAHPHRVLP